MTSQEPLAVPDPAERLEELMEGFQVTQALSVAAKLNLADVLREGPKSSTELATAVGAHAPLSAATDALSGASRRSR